MLFLLTMLKCINVGYCQCIFSIALFSLSIGRTPALPAASFFITTLTFRYHSRRPVETTL